MRSTATRRVVGLLFALFGLYSMPGAIREIYRGIDAKGWPQTEAKLVQAEVVSGRGGRSFPRVSYHYIVREARLTGDVIAFGNEWASAGRQIDNLRNETPLLAYYDPDDPSKAILHPGLTFGAMYQVFLAMAFIVAGLVNLLRPPR